VEAKTVRAASQSAHPQIRAARFRGEAPILIKEISHVKLPVVAEFLHVGQSSQDIPINVVQHRSIEACRLRFPLFETHLENFSVLVALA
jgi:hypothetical protein